MKKKMPILLAALLCLSLTACGGCRHSWKEADCLHPRTCTLCGKTEGKALGHEPGQWLVAFVDCAKGEMTSELRCTRCDALLESKVEPMDQSCIEDAVLEPMS